MRIVTATSTRPPAIAPRRKFPLPETCAQCHENQVTQFKKGKHALAWAPWLKAVPTIHWQPMAMTEGEKGCGGCHKIGDKTLTEVLELRQNGSGTEFGAAQCDACHTRHTFSVEEARSPQACETCHMGFDHPQWEMYSASKHGVRNELKQKHLLPANAAAPTCQTCHMQEGNHEVRTAWGFLAVRLPLPEDKTWPPIAPLFSRPWAFSIRRDSRRSWSMSSRPRTWHASLKKIGSASAT